MHSRIVTVAVICSCLTIVNAHANDQQQIRSYIKRNFPAEFVINAAQISQLAWAFQHDKRTNDMDLQVADQQVYVEISRALTRLYCAQLLRRGTREAYNQFVSAQLATGVTETIAFSSFTKFAQHIQQLSQLDYELLQAAAILSAVSLSKPAAELARKAMHVQPTVNDNMGFLATTLRNGINIYPLTANIMRDNTAARKLLYILFPPQTNFRHMLYTEGGIGMFKYLRSMIMHGFIDRDGLDLWYAHWIINIAGFRGHVDQRGSVYLTEPVAQCMQTLKGHVYQMLEVPNYNPLLPYLEYRAKRLGFTHLPEEERLFLGHLGSLLRLYNITEGQQLYNSVAKLSGHKMQGIKNYFFAGLHNTTQYTHMHLPAVLGNALKLTNGDLDQVIAQILPVYDAILRDAGQKNITTSLSLHTLSASANVKQLLIENAAETRRFKILEDGSVLLG